MPLPFSRLAIQNPQPFSRHMLPLSRLLIFWLWPLPSGHLSPPPPRKCHHLLFFVFFPVALLYWLWQRPGSLLATSFALAFSCFCFGPSSFHWCRPCWLLRALSGLLLFTAAAAGGAGLLLFGVGLLLFGTCQVKKMMWEYLCSQDLIFL